jgi:uncharacterized membrane protein
MLLVGILGLARLFAAFQIPGPVFWTYLAGTTVLVLGLAVVFREEFPKSQGMDKAALFGPVLLATPMAVFGAEHFVFAKGISTGVPAWIPWHLFWTFLVGTALIAAALSIAAKKYSALAAALLGAMIFSFVLLIHIPNAIASPGDRIRLAVALRDTSFSAGAIAYAVAQAQSSRRGLHRAMLRLVRCVIGVVTVVFGVEHFLHPQNVPLVPLAKLVPAWIPGHMALAFVTGAVLIVCGVAIVFNWKARAVATWLGTYSVAVLLLVYLPILIAKPSDIGDAVNYFVDTMVYCGCILLLAGALPKEAHQGVAVAEHTEAERGIGLPQGGEA